MVYLKSVLKVTDLQVVIISLCSRLFGIQHQYCLLGQKNKLQPYWCFAVYIPTKQIELTHMQMTLASATALPARVV